MSFAEVEKPERLELRQITPPLSRLYHNLKKSCFHLSHSYEQHVSFFGRFFDRNLQEVSQAATEICKVTITDTRG